MDFCGVCYECIDQPELGFKNPTLSRMICCTTCGNKRCPRATSHHHVCTGSNEPGQRGSRYSDDYVAPLPNGDGVDK